MTCYFVFVYSVSIGVRTAVEFWVMSRCRLYCRVKVRLRVRVSFRFQFGIMATNCQDFYFTIFYYRLPDDINSVFRNVQKVLFQTHFFQKSQWLSAVAFFVLCIWLERQLSFNVFTFWCMVYFVTQFQSTVTFACQYQFSCVESFLSRVTCAVRLVQNHHSRFLERYVKALK